MPFLRVSSSDPQISQLQGTCGGDNLRGCNVLTTTPSTLHTIRSAVQSIVYACEEEISWGGRGRFWTCPKTPHKGFVSDGLGA